MGTNTKPNIALVDGEGRVCSVCGEYKRKEEFFKRGGTKKGIRSACRRCTNLSRQKYRQDNLELVREQERDSHYRRTEDTREKDRLSQRNSRLKQKFGLTLAQLSVLLEVQNGCCAICTSTIFISAPGRGSRALACVDHDHKTGKVRGLLCNSCNTAIGLLGDDFESVERALSYLRRHR